MIQLGQFILALVTQQGVAVEDGLGRVGVVKDGILDIFDQLGSALFVDVDTAGTIGDDGCGSDGGQDAFDVGSVARWVGVWSHL